MAKHMNNQKQRPNFFSRNIEKFGEDFLGSVRQDSLVAESIRIFRDMSYGNIDVTRYLPYIMDQRLLMPMQQAAFSKFSLHSISANGVALLRKNIIESGSEANNNIIEVLNYHTRAAEAYNIILTAVKSALISNDANCMVTLPGLLRNYRNCL